MLFLPLLIFGVSLSAGFSNERKETCPTVYITQEGASGMKAGEVFTVFIGVRDLDKNLYGFDIMLKWDSSSLEYLTHEVRVPVEKYFTGVLHEPVLEVANEVDYVKGTCWIAYASLLPAEAFNGDGTFFTVTFKVTKESNCNFTFEHIFLASKEGEVIMLADQSPQPPSVSFDSAMNEHREIRAEKWLEWWITVTWQMSKRRATASGR